MKKFAENTERDFRDSSSQNNKSQPKQKTPPSQQRNENPTKLWKPRTAIAGNDSPDIGYRIEFSRGGIPKKKYYSNK
jgi:hypothetical protein